MPQTSSSSPMAMRFRGYLPIVVDIETAGFNAQTDALLEIAAIILIIDENGIIKPQTTHHCHIIPFEGANLDQDALEFNGIDPYHPFRFAVSEKEALQTLFKPIRKAMKADGCHRAILVGHNPTFDLGFLKQVVKRCDYKRDPFHPFTTFDTATLSGLALEHTVLATSVKRAGLQFDDKEAHTALYDAQKTAELFCYIVNKWKKLTDYAMVQNLKL